MQLPVDTLKSLIGGTQLPEKVKSSIKTTQEDLNMIFAEKLVQLRKKAGWSQEELAAQTIS